MDIKKENLADTFSASHETLFVIPGLSETQIKEEPFDNEMSINDGSSIKNEPTISSIVTFFCFLILMLDFNSILISIKVISDGECANVLMCY